MKEFTVNKYITLKLEDNIPKDNLIGSFIGYIAKNFLKVENKTTVIYVNGIRFDQCKFLLLDVPKNQFDSMENIDNIDEAAEKLDHSLEINFQGNYEGFSPETEFWAHSSVRHESCMVECGNLRNTKMVSLLMNKPSRNRPRDGRVWLLRHASLEMRLCEALRTMYRQKRLRSCCGLAKDPMANDCKFAINPVRAQGRNVVKRLSKDMLTEGDA